MKNQKASEIKDSFVQEYMMKDPRRKHIYGVGVGDVRGRPCLKVFLTKYSPHWVLPKTYKGLRVYTEVTEEFTAF